MCPRVVSPPISPSSPHTSPLAVATATPPPCAFNYMCTCVHVCNRAFVQCRSSYRMKASHFKCQVASLRVHVCMCGSSKPGLTLVLRSFRALRSRAVRSGLLTFGPGTCLSVSSWSCTSAAARAGRCRSTSHPTPPRDATRMHLDDEPTTDTRHELARVGGSRTALRRPTYERGAT